MSTERLLSGQPSRRHPYLSGNFAPIQKTLPLTPCTYEGTIPRDLAGGQYVRNGGNPVSNEDLGRDAHWFDGDGMLSGVLFRRVGEKGEQTRPEFVNQFLITDLYSYTKQNAHLRKPILPSIATLVNPAASVFLIIWAVLRTIFHVILSHLSAGPGRFAIKKISVANTNVLYHDGRALATCESGVPLRFALPGLETIGWFNGRTVENEPAPKTPDTGKGGFGGDGLISFMKEWTTAHPRVDPVTQELMAFHSNFIKPYCYYSILPPTSSRTTKNDAEPQQEVAKFSLPVPGVTAPKMMHDFGASRQHTVILDLPLTLDPTNLARGVPVLSYDSTGLSRFGVFPRYRPDQVRWFETNPCVIFHTANCWDSTAMDEHAEQETSVNMLACRLTSASLVFSAGNLPTPEVKPVPPEYAEEEQCRLYYYNFPLQAAEKLDGRNMIRHQWSLSAIPFEFPTISPAHSMSNARYIYGCSTSSASYTVALGKASKVDYLAKIDAQTLIARGVAHPPQQVKGCVDPRSVGEVMRSSVEDDPVKLFEMPDGWYAQESRFVPKINAATEDDGYLLTYVFDESQLDPETGECIDSAASELWIIDARNMRDIVCKIRLPQRVPYGLHGTWFSEDEIQGQRPYEALRTLDETPRRASPLRTLMEKWLG